MKYLGIGLVIIILLGAGYWYLNTKPGDGGNNVVPISMNDSGVVSDGGSADGGERVGGGSYVVYTPEEFAAVAGQRRVLFFYANWCPTCVPADQDFQANESQIPGNVVVLRVNYNDTDTDAQEKALADQYGVTYQHTFVQVDANGEVVTRWNGGRTADLVKNVK